jgi:hypothetical protein
MNFDDMLRDPSTITIAKSSHQTPFWSEIEYIPQPIQLSLSINFSFSFLTPVQELIFSSLSCDRKIYNIISPPNTGKTTVLMILSLLRIKEYGRRSVLWIVQSQIIQESIKSQFLKLDSSLVISTENFEENSDVFLISNQSKDTKKIEFIFENCKKELKMVVFDSANEILAAKQKRSFFGKFLTGLYQEQVGTIPILYFTQLGNSTTHVSTFINEVSQFTEHNSRLFLNPYTLENPSFSTFESIPQYYIQMSSGRIIQKLLGNTIIRIKKGILVFGNLEDHDLNNVQYDEIGSTTQESVIFAALEKLRTRRKKMLICRCPLPKHIKTCGIGAVVHMGVPSDPTGLDIQEYRARVERVFSPTFVGISVLVCLNDDVEKVRRLKEILNVNIEPFPS